MVTKTQKIQALQLARVKIDKGDQRFICIALDKVALDKPALDEAIAALRLYISNALYPYAYLGSWQVKQPIGYRDAFQQRHDRLAWIDWMIDSLLTH